MSNFLNELEADNITDVATFTLNNETFEAPLKKDGLGMVSFYDQGGALELYRRYLFAALLDEEVSGGNIWNLFYGESVSFLFQFPLSALKK